MKFRRSLALLVAMLALVGTAAAGQWRFDDVDRVVAISDIHGAYDHMVRTLQSAGVIDAALAWAGGTTHLVIVGDILDRGPNSRSAMDLLMRLEGEAAAAGGQVHVLIGNHEAMNLVGDLRYVSKAEYEAFASDEDIAERERWFEAYARNRASADKTPEELRALFDRSYPAGYFGHRKAFSPTGKYGAWLLGKPVIVIINGTAFVHGGLSPMIGEIGLAGVNDRLRGEMLRYVRGLDVLHAAGVLLPTDSFYEHVPLLDNYLPPLDASPEVMDAVATVRQLHASELHSPEGPLWYRGNASCGVLIEADRLEAVLVSIGARRVVIGHTPTSNRRILERFGGTVIEVDTGMLADYYKGSGNALVIDGDELAVFNEASGEPGEPGAHPRRVGQRPDGYLSASEIETLLAEGEIVANAEDESGLQVVTVSDGQHSLDAVFARRAGRGIFPETAAYRLDRLLDLGMVPVTVNRRVGRFDGSLQFRVPGSVDEQLRREKGWGGGAQCPLPDQWEAILVFDALIHNASRYARTIRYSPDSWQVLLVGHDGAFTTDKGRPPHLADRPLSLNAHWRAALEALSDEVLEQRLGDVLDMRRLGALEARRDALLAQP